MRWWLAFIRKWSQEIGSRKSCMRWLRLLLIWECPLTNGTISRLPLTTWDKPPIKWKNSKWALPTLDRHATNGTRNRWIRLTWDLRLLTIMRRSWSILKREMFRSIGISISPLQKRGDSMAGTYRTWTINFWAWLASSRITTLKMSFTNSMIMKESWVLISHEQVMYLSQAIIEIKIKYQLKSRCAGEVEINSNFKSTNFI